MSGECKGFKCMQTNLLSLQEQSIITPCVNIFGAGNLILLLLCSHIIWSFVIKHVLRIGVYFITCSAPGAKICH